MKVKCNVCIKGSITELQTPTQEDETKYCPECGKIIAECYANYKNELCWYIPDSVYDKEWGGIPVQILTN